MKELHEQQDLNYTGTIIDIETIGDTQRGYPKYDSREFNAVKIVIFGFISAKSLHIYCAEGINEIDHLKQHIQSTITPELAKPLYAYNAHYEMGTIYHHYGIKLPFDFELQPREYLRKEDYMRELNINNSFNDPFSYPPSPGLQCRMAWQKQLYTKAMMHNRACLLKEQSIMLTNTFKPIIPFTFNDVLAPYTSNSGNSFQLWTQTQKDIFVTMWNQGNTISMIATKLNRSPRAIWMQGQKQGLIANNIIYDNSKNNVTFRDLK